MKSDELFFGRLVTPGKNAGTRMNVDSMDMHEYKVETIIDMTI